MFKAPASTTFQKLKTHLKNNALLKKKPIRALLFFLKSWWHIVTLALICFICLYYPLGGYLIHNIDKETNYEENLPDSKQLATVKTVSDLVSREINDKIWTPNLPVFFPSYFLDNMPAFQLGIINSLANFTTALPRVFPPLQSGQNKPDRLKTAAELLNYPGNVWLFSPDNNLTPAPSSTRQYRAAIRQLNKYNMAVSAGIISYQPTDRDLKYLIGKIRNNLTAAANELERQIREFSSSWIDTRADDVFYYNQGKAYAAFLELKALGYDYKEIIVSAGQYENWTKALKTLEEAAAISPLIVRNGSLNSLTAPNHLVYLNAHIQKTCFLLLKISNQLNKDQNAY